MKNNNQLEIFENNLKDLEAVVEDLSCYLDSNITGQNSTDLEHQIRNLNRFI